MDQYLFKPQYSEIDLGRADKLEFHADSWDFDGDQYQTIKDGWIYNEETSAYTQAFSGKNNYLHQGTH